MNFYEIGTTLLTEIETKLTDKPARVGMVPGRIVADACDCGVLAGSIVRVYGSEVFPLPYQGVICRAPYIVAELLITLFRCAPTMDERGTPPSVPALDGAAEAWESDARTVRDAVLCKLEELRDETNEIIDFRWEGQLANGPEGACVGVDTSILVALAD